MERDRDRDGEGDGGARRDRRCLLSRAVIETNRREPFR